MTFLNNKLIDRAAECKTVQNIVIKIELENVLIAPKNETWCQDSNAQDLKVKFMSRIGLLFETWLKSPAIVAFWVYCIDGDIKGSPLDVNNRSICVEDLNALIVILSIVKIYFWALFSSQFGMHNASRVIEP